MPLCNRHQALSGLMTATATAENASVTVYKPAFTTYFGHGFYGSHMACGAVLTHRTLGVAHRTLPCGTLVDFSYRGRPL